MDLIQLILRLIAFAVTLFILLDFIVICDVKNWVCLTAAACCIIFVIIIFIVLRRHRTSTCPECGRKVARNRFDKKYNSGVIKYPPKSKEIKDPFEAVDASILG